MPDERPSTRLPRRIAHAMTVGGAGAGCLAFTLTALGLLAVATVAGPLLVPGALQPIAHHVEHAPVSTLTAVLFALGAPLHWRLSSSVTSAHMTGTLRAGALVHGRPWLGLALTLVVGTLVLASFRAVRSAQRSRTSVPRALAGAAAAFTLITAVAALIVARSSVDIGGGITARVHVQLASAVLLAAAWSALGGAAAWLLASRTTLAHHHIADQPAVRAWATRLAGPISGLAVSGLLLASLGGAQGVQVVADGTTRPTVTHAPASTSTTAGADNATAAGAQAGGAGGNGTTSTTGAAGGRGSRSGQATTSTTARSKGGSTTGTTTRAASATAADAALPPPSPGTYTYNTSGSASWGLGSTTFSPTSTLVVDRATGARQHSRRQILTAAGQGFVMDQWLEYQPGGIRVAEQMITTTFNGSHTVRDLKAPSTQLFLSDSPTVGEHHAFDLASPSETAHEVVDVLRTENVTIGGQTVRAFVVRTVLSLGGGASGTLEFDQWFVPGTRMVVKEHTTATVGSGLVRLKSTYDATLQHL